MINAEKKLDGSCTFAAQSTAFSVFYKLTSDVVLLWYLNSWISLLTWWPNLSSRTLDNKDM